MTRLSRRHFRSNEARLWLSVIAYNLWNQWRRLVLPKEIDNWSLTTLQAAVDEYVWRAGQTRALLIGRGGSLEAWSGRIARLPLQAG